MVQCWFVGLFRLGGYTRNFSSNPIEFIDLIEPIIDPLLSSSDSESETLTLSFMAGQDTSSPTISGGKHRRSSEVPRDESSKRRKHRHRHRHSHRHGRDRKEDDAAKTIENEIEEGEILDDAQSDETKLQTSDSDFKKIPVCFLGSIISPPRMLLYLA